MLDKDIGYGSLWIYLLSTVFAGVIVGFWQKFNAHAIRVRKSILALEVDLASRF